MARLLGIDYGSQKIGLALSDEAGSMAFPLKIIKSDAHAVAHVRELVDEHAAAGVVIGYSHNLRGEENPIMKKIQHFKEALADAVEVPIYFESEVYTSREAERIQGKHDMLDASAATLLLQSFLDKQ